ncbi:MAG: methylmalonyl Co-A mutase-associated GTPase MeaB [Candidatus Cloacimonetes bacterium]|nr:methylmalonyl Co-A mutase-associated GTPase MeaB [Candidatus Cloacimonadota bacterium]
MSDKRKPEWAPLNSGSEFASRIVSGENTIVNPMSNRDNKKTARQYELSELVEGVRDSNRTLLSKAITLIESNSEKHFQMGQELLNQLLPLSGASIRIGITGVPGAGKSTFIENFGLSLIEKGHKVAVLAIDPSSCISKGSILGDKTRMEKLSCHPASFIRPSPSAGVLGGVARKTRESIILCEAAGYDTILIETVGVGQSETTVRSMVDFFLLMQIAGAGDELQGIKKGIIELADLIVINKSDGDNIQRAELAKQEFSNALHYIRHATDSWQTKAVLCSALFNDGLDVIWDVVQDFKLATINSGAFKKRRTEQSIQWFESLLAESVLHSFYQSKAVIQLLPELKEKVSQGSLPVALAVSTLISAGSR